MADEPTTPADPQTFGIGRDDGQGRGRGSEQNAVDETFVLASNGRDLFGKREDHMKITEMGFFAVLHTRGPESAR
jgi:hypothetical protein